MTKKETTKLHALDDFCMKKALLLAKRAFRADEVPVGALVVDSSNKVIGRGYNQVEKRKSQRAHAEQLAIEQACKKIGDWRLEGCTLYVTLEPCTMCMGLIKLSRIERVVFGAASPLFGYQLDKNRKSQLYKKGVIKIRKGVGKATAAALLKDFFKNKRM
ncbi:MAG: tRNA-specific adenosine deaminase [Candidatus Dependentiae bacterium ADurb.Bin331]|nr:MAG: tRNA-specific adenosine deaminase [Candidatus Dependentiae bacterium ADurb.Bin331]